MLQEDVYGTVSNHVGLLEITQFSEYQNCDKFDLSSNGASLHVRSLQLAYTFLLINACRSYSISVFFLQVVVQKS